MPSMSYLQALIALALIEISTIMKRGITTSSNDPSIGKIIHIGAESIITEILMLQTKLP